MPETAVGKKLQTHVGSTVEDEFDEVVSIEVRAPGSFNQRSNNDHGRQRIQIGGMIAFFLFPPGALRQNAAPLRLRNYVRRFVRPEAGSAFQSRWRICVRAGGDVWSPPSSVCGSPTTKACGIHSLIQRLRLVQSTWLSKTSSTPTSRALIEIQFPTAIPIRRRAHVEAEHRHDIAHYARPE